MKKVKYEKSATRKKCNMEMPKLQKSATRKNCNMMKIQQEKSAERKSAAKVQHEEHNMKKCSTKKTLKVKQTAKREKSAT